MDRHHAPLMGLLYLWDLPFILAGIYFLINKSFPFKSKITVFWWFLIAPVAASVTWGVPHSLRTAIYLPIFQIFAAIGFYQLLVIPKRKFLMFIAIVALALSFMFYLHQYYVHMPKEFSKSWLYGRKEAVIFSESRKFDYDRVIVSTKLEQPHEFWLFYLKYDPKKYLEEGGTVSGGFLETKNHFDKYFFRPIDPTNDKNEQTLIVALPDEMPTGARILKKIYYLNGEEAIYVGDFR
jgi:hypothetical protein